MFPTDEPRHAATTAATPKIRRGAGATFSLLTAAWLLAPAATAQEATLAPLPVPGASAAVRLVHASPDAPLVDVYVDGAEVAADLAFGETTDLIDLPAGERDLAVVPAGRDLANAVIDAQDVALAPGQAYQVVAVGPLSEIEAAIFPLDRSPLPADTARVRFVHAAPDTPGVEVAVADGSVLFDATLFGSASGFAEIPTGRYDLEVGPAGTEDVALALDGVALEGGRVYDVVAVGTLADDTLDALVLDAPVAGGPAFAGSPAFDPFALPDPSVDFTGQGFALRTLETPAGEITFYEAGDGQPLVFLHGIGGGASSWQWSKVAPAFTDDYRVVVPDYVGWGASEHPRRFLLFADYAAQVEALLRDLGEPALVVASSLSAGFAADVADRNPDLVAGLLLFSPGGGNDFGSDAIPPFFRELFEPVIAQPVANALFYRQVFFSEEFVRRYFETDGFADPRAVSQEVVDAFLWSARQPGALYSAFPFLSGDLRYDFAPYLRGLAVPAAMVYGAGDTQVAPETQRRFAALNPDVPLLEIPRAAANPELELPAETIRAVREALAGFAGD